MSKQAITGPVAAVERVALLLVALLVLLLQPLQPRFCLVAALPVRRQEPARGVLPNPPKRRLPLGQAPQR